MRPLLPPPPCVAVPGFTVTLLGLLPRGQSPEPRGEGEGGSRQSVGRDSQTFLCEQGAPFRAKLWLGRKTQSL